jgi:hypothetical protein
MSGPFAPIEACASRRRGPYAEIEPLVAFLRERGWSPERLVKNDLLEPAGIAGRDYDYHRFWTTIARLAREMARLGLPPIFIKCVREYAYCDANVDLLVPHGRLREVGRELAGRAWRRPEPWDAFEQLLIERDKLKLPATESGLVAAHLYGAVSWRYQADIGLLRRNGSAVDPEHLREARVEEFAPFAAAGSPAIWLPRPAAEFVLQAAHVAFENYRVTVGEALHFRLLRLRAASEWEDAERLARRFGCAAALRLLDTESAAICADLGALAPADYPRTLPIGALAPVFAERARVLWTSRRRAGAAAETATAASVWFAVAAIRRLRRLRRGVEDYRH